MWPVSVIVPTWNEPPGRIARTVNSALHAFADEVIVVDDGSAEPPTVPIRPQVSLFIQGHGGIASALNRGLKESRNNYIATLGVGDIMAADRLGVQITKLEERGYLACFSDYIDGVTREPVIAAPNWKERIWYDNQFCQSATLMHKSAIYAVDGWDESLEYSVDWKFALAIEHACGWLYVPETVGEAGEHPGGHTDRARIGPLWKRKCYDRAMVARWARKHQRMRHGLGVAA